MRKTVAHPRSTVRTVAEANHLLSKFFPRLGGNIIGTDLVARGPDARRGNIDMLRHRHIGWSIGEACGARREWRVSCDWEDDKEAHEAFCTLAYRWEGKRSWEPA